FLVAQCWSAAILSDIKLSSSEPPRVRPTVLARLGLDDEAVFEVDWDDLDRVVTPDHLTSLYIPALGAPIAGEMTRLAQLVRRLRADCPWDRAQTHESLTRHFVEETYEVLEAIEDLVAAQAGAQTGAAGHKAQSWAASLPDRPAGDSVQVGRAESALAESALAESALAESALAESALADAYTHLEEELGDVLFQVFFHAGLAGEAGQFDVADVARSVHDKLVGRHPHVFGSVRADTPDQVMANWEQIKKAEKGRSSLMDGIPRSLPALLYAHKVQRKAASVGLDWPDVTGAMAKVTEELAEVQLELEPGGARLASQEPVGAHRPSQEPGGARLADEAGDLLFSAVNVVRHLGLDPEAVLRGAAGKFADRFRSIERSCEHDGVDPAGLSPAEWDQAWERSKLSPG
ncbi:MAG: MazG family protein, partial [Sciscionella sp.]